MRACFGSLLEEIQAVWSGHVYVCLDLWLPEELNRAQSRPTGRAGQAGWHRRRKHKTTTDRRVEISWPRPRSCLFEPQSLPKRTEKIFLFVCLGLCHMDTYC